MDRMAGLPFREVTFDAEGDLDGTAQTVLSDLRDEGVTDVLVFSHGWNNDRATARRLYERFFGEVRTVLDEHGRPDRSLGVLGIYWPSRRWTDEPAPDLDPADLPDLGRGGVTASVDEEAPSFDPPPPPDEETRAAIHDAFPQETGAVDELVDLLQARPHDESKLDRAHELVSELLRSAGTGPADDDGDGAGGIPKVAEPGRNPRDVASTFVQAMEDLGVVTTGPGGQAGLLGSIGRLWHGAQELARQATYWQMKKRAGVVGERGLGPLVREMLDAGLEVTLVGHSFGARLVSFALRALDTGRGTVRGVVLLQGAFSQFTFSRRLPHDPARSGALEGLQTRVAGPLVACHSRFDEALGTFYPLASVAAGQDASAIEELQARWGAIGFGGHQPPQQRERLHSVATSYDFTGGSLVSIDVAGVVRRGRPPSGAHSDIVHPELAWIVVCAAGLVAQ